VLFSVAAEEWLEHKKPHLAPKSYQIEKTNLTHLKPKFGKLLTIDIDANDVSRYQAHRLAEAASPKTVNLEVGTLRAILRKHRLWAELQPDVKMLPTRDDVGRAISEDEETRLLAACETSRSRALLPAVVLALNTGMRYDEIRTLRWKQVDLERRTVTVGKSKTQAGAGRTIPLNDRARLSLQFWADQFPERKQEHCVFPAEGYGLAGH
jgi:integrase